MPPLLDAARALSRSRPARERFRFRVRRYRPRARRSPSGSDPSAPPACAAAQAPIRPLILRAPRPSSLDWPPDYIMISFFALARAPIFPGGGASPKPGLHDASSVDAKGDRRMAGRKYLSHLRADRRVLRIASA